MPDTITRDHAVESAIEEDPVLVLYQQWLDANRSVEAVVKAGQGLELGPECKAQEKRLARALSRRNRIQDQIEQTPATTTTGLCARLEIAAFDAEEMLSPNRLIVLAARDDARRLFGTLPAPSLVTRETPARYEEPSAIEALHQLWCEADKVYDAADNQRLALTKVEEGADKAQKQELHHAKFTIGLRSDEAYRRRDMLQHAIAAIPATSLRDAYIQLAIAELEVDQVFAFGGKSQAEIDAHDKRISFLIDSACRFLEREFGFEHRREMGVFERDIATPAAELIEKGWGELAKHGVARSC